MHSDSPQACNVTVLLVLIAYPSLISYSLFLAAFLCHILYRFHSNY